jgi:t-SNARE complex subunit (syntaxin)
VFDKTLIDRRKERKKKRTISVMVVIFHCFILQVMVYVTIGGIIPKLVWIFIGVR